MADESTTIPLSKRPKLTNESDLLSILNDDALREVLVRTCASDHPALRCTCRKMKTVLNSSSFRHERAMSEWAEVSVSIEDEDDLDCGEAYGGAPGSILQGSFEVYVDGKAAGNGSFTCVTRETNRFIEICDEISGQMSETSLLFFDKRGRSRVASVRKAIEKYDDTRPFLYLDEFKLTKDYRDSTWVGAKAIRALLTENYILQYSWAVVIYIADAASHFTTEDPKIRHVVSVILDKKRGERTDQEQHQVDEWRKRTELLCEHDLRQFFRAGFRQVKEVVYKTDCDYVFAVPSFLDDALISHDEAASIKIVRKKSPVSKPPLAVNGQLLEFIISSCSQKRCIRSSVENVLPADERARRMVSEAFGPNMSKLRELKRAMEETKQQLRNQEEERVRSVETIDGSDLSKASLLQHTQDYFDRARTMLEQKEIEVQQICQQASEIREKGIREIREAIERQDEERKAAVQSEVASLNAKVRSEVTRFICEAGASIADSNALHACAANTELEYLELLLEFVPESKRREVVNRFDNNGCTPLMVAAAGRYGDATSRYSLLEKLIELGADKNVKDASGETALGKFREKKRSDRDFVDIFHWESDNEAAEVLESARLESLLRPLEGATPADDEYLHDNSLEDEDLSSDDSDE